MIDNQLDERLVFRITKNVVGGTNFLFSPEALYICGYGIFT